MKTGLTAFLVLALCAGAVDAAGAKKERKQARDPLLARYDVNHNGVLNDDERAAVEKDFIDRFDKNANKRLDSDELDAVRQELAQQAAAKGRKKSK